MTFIRLRLLLHCGTLPNVKIGIKERKIIPDSFWGTASSEAPLLRVPVHQNAKCPVRDRLENPPSIPKRRPGLWLPNRLQPNPTMKGGWRSPQQPPCSDGAGEESLRQGSPCINCAIPLPRMTELPPIYAVFAVISDCAPLSVLFCAGFRLRMDSRENTHSRLFPKISNEDHSFVFDFDGGFASGGFLKYWKRH